MAVALDAVLGQPDVSVLDARLIEIGHRAVVVGRVIGRLRGEDDDGNAASKKPSIDASMMADHLTAIQDATNEDALKKAYTDAYKACGTDANWQKRVIAAKDARKAQL